MTDTTMTETDNQNYQWSINLANALENVFPNIALATRQGGLTHDCSQLSELLQDTNPNDGHTVHSKLKPCVL